jgi:ABC-type lipoprotein release transport system permease subunit
MPALAAQFPILTNFRQFFLNAPGAAAFRGIVLGLAVGVVLALLLKVFSIFTGRRSQTQVRETD